MGALDESMSTKVFNVDIMIEVINQGSHFATTFELFPKKVIDLRCIFLKFVKPTNIFEGISLLNFKES